MANPSVGSSSSLSSGLALSSNNPIFTSDDLDSSGSGWEVIEGDELLAEVKSLDSFSVSSQSEGEEAESLNGGLDPIEITTTDSAEDLPQVQYEGTCPDFEGFHFHRSGKLICSSHPVNEDDLREELPVPHDLVTALGFRTYEVNPVRTPTGSRDDRHPRRDGEGYVLDGNDDGENYGYPKHDDENDDDECGNGVDDELVPWGISNRLEKQRMRKLGKRGCAKMKNSKKLAHVYVQAACARGKHGLGLKVY